MNKRSLQTLEYNKIIEMLTGYAHTQAGKEQCKHLVPSTELPEILARQEETKDALSRIYKHGNLSISGTTDIIPSLKRLAIGASLSAHELLDIAKLLEVTLHAKQYSRNDLDIQDQDSLDPLFEELSPLSPLCMEIKRCIVSEDEISDEASAALKDIRRSIKQTNMKLHNQLSSLVSSSANKGLLQDNLITMRNGRYCIPVKQEHRGSFPGMIHDQSSTGSTLFIEPMAIVNLNNELKELSGKEEIEIERILSILSEQVSFEHELIEINYSVLTQLDFIFARGTFAKSYDGTQPDFNDKGIINIKQGRHPLLDKKRVVPINIYLGEDFSMLLITGPNTGGKTVALKTVGLFTLMGQSGLHIPAYESSRLAVFDEVFSDIGDEQSIEQNLSTFSSHMTNIVKILEQATPDSLVLLDELCGGTDPVEGAALAISILNRFHSQQIRTVATTHYSELKLHALSTAGIENASCEFDINTLTPTYRLLIGIPGKSNAFAISSKLGLSESIITDATNQIDASAKDFESLLSDLEESRVKFEKEQEELYQTKKEIAQLQKNLEMKQDDLAEKRAALLEAARREARDILSTAKETADDAIRKYNNWGKEPKNNHNKEMEAERSRLRGKMTDIESKLSYQGKKSSKKVDVNHLKLGDPVYVNTLSLEGTVSTLPNNKGDLYVQMGILRSLVNIKDIEPMDIIPEKKAQPQKASSNNRMKSASIRPEINLLGRSVDDALMELDKYLDDAYMCKLPHVTIIHGKGTGALRSAIQAHLKKQRHIKSFRSGQYGEGEAGVTIVEF